MARYKSYDQDQGLFIVFDKEINYPEGNFVRFLNDFIEDHIDIDAFSKKRNNDQTGAPAKHAKMMLKVIFYAFTQGIISMREVSKKYLGKHIDFIYLSGNQSVDHSTLSRFINNYSEEIIEIFTKTFFISHNAGYVTKKLIAIDGSKIKANASKKFTGDYSIFLKKRDLYKKMISNLLKRSERLAQKEEKRTIKEYDARKERKNIDRLKKSYTNMMSRIDGFIEECEKGERDKKEKVNLIDKDSILVEKDNKFYQGYNCQAGVNEHGMIVMNDVKRTASDRKLGEEMIEKSSDELRRQGYSDKGIKKITYLLDRGYNDSKAIGNLMRDNYNILIPFYKSTSANLSKKITTQHCKLKKNGNTCILECPGGILKKCKKMNLYRDGYYYRFFFYKSECINCKYYSRCSGLVKKTKKFQVSKEIFDNLKELNKLRSRLSKPDNIDKYNKRLGLVEPVFGTIGNRNSNKFYVRGIEKVQCNWNIVCSAFNLRRTFSLCYS